MWLKDIGIVLVLERIIFKEVRAMFLAKMSKLIKYSKN